MTDAADNVVALSDEGPRYREPPHNTEVEAALLGALLTNNRAFEQVAFVRPEHFYELVHGRIFAKIAELRHEGKQASPLTLKHLFANDEGLTEVGGAQYLYELATSVVSVINAKDYAETVVDLYSRRAVIGYGETLVNRAYDEDDTATSAIIEGGIQDLSALVDTAGRGGAAPLGSLAAQGLENIDRRRSGKEAPGLAIGLRALDAKLNPLMPGQNIILAGRPGQGKTTLAMTIARLIARGFDDQPPAPVLIFSQEMSAAELAEKYLGGAANIDTQKLIGKRARGLSQREMDALIDAARDAGSLPIWIDDRPARTVLSMREQARHFKRQHGLGLAVVDHLQLTKANEETRRENATARIEGVSRDLKAMAKSLEVPLLTLSQLRRPQPGAKIMPPGLDDLRQSGAIEEDADVVMFIHREEYYAEREMNAASGRRDPDSLKDYMDAEAKLKAVKGMAQIILAKQRGGPVGSCDLAFHAATQTFADLARGDGGEGLL